MIRETPPKPAAPAQPRPSWKETLRDPTIGAIVVYTTLALAMAAAAYFWIFTTFAGYDDEGTLLVSLQAFAHGEVLYRDVYSPYGPFYYELFGGFFALTGAAVTNDISRTIVVIFWVATSFLYGISIQRLSGRLWLGAAGMCAAFSTMYVLANEPMHPQVLCVALLGAVTLLAVSGPGRNPALAGGAAGALIAALALTKLNLGVYAAAAAVLAAVMTLEPLRSRSWIRWPVALVIVAMPAAVVFRDLNTEWARNLAGVEILSMAAIVAVGLRLRWRGRDDGLRRWLVGAAVGFAVAFVAILVAIMVTGSTLSDVYGGMVTEALRVREVNPGAFPMANQVVDWAIASFGLACLCAWMRPGEPGAPAWWSGALRIVAGLVILLGVANVHPLSISPSPQNTISLPMVLVWVAAFAPAVAEESQFKAFLRIFLPALAVAEGLQVYPVPGSQIGIAALTFVPVGALCISDGLDVLRAWSGARGRVELERAGAVATVGLVVLTAIMALNVVVRPGINSASTYKNQPSLGLPGGTDLHLPEDQVQAYQAMVADLHKYGCTDFIGYPNINSLYLWSGIEPPPPAAPGVWHLALTDKPQQRIVNELRASQKPCVIRSENRAALWLGGREVPQRPLVRYIFGDFRPVQTVGEFEFMLPKPSATD
ncbi:MAG TPA: hypothetical protein VFP17_01140 [Solirubrobacterales bacterium]|nr:hypothetical protein [Solirubrobacterales bacterium]